VYRHRFISIHSELHTHTYTHTHIYIYIYIYLELISRSALSANTSCPGFALCWFLRLGFQRFLSARGGLMRGSVGWFGVVMGIVGYCWAVWFSVRWVYLSLATHTRAHVQSLTHSIQFSHAHTHTHTLTRWSSGMHPSLAAAEAAACAWLRHCWVGVCAPAPVCAYFVCSNIIRVCMSIPHYTTMHYAALLIPLIHTHTRFRRVRATSRRSASLHCSTTWFTQCTHTKVMNTL
jgi:hypothetical protein